jgi:8-amino-7-oxononanoate synthase
MSADFLQRLATECAQFAASGRLRELREIEPLGDGRCQWQNRTFWNLSSNDYLGLACRDSWRREFYALYETDSPELALTSASSRLLTGNTPAYGRLEAVLSTLYGGRAALVFNSGYHANVGILPALASSEDLILSDKLNHASMIDGMRLSDAEFQRFRHLDYDHVERILSEKRATYQRVFLVTESIFSMDGDAADLQRLVELKKKYDCLLVVDEAHAVGVYGPHGAGLAAAMGVDRDVDILIGTFGKAFASVGAYAVMAPEVRHYLINTMRPFIFTTALPPVVLNWSAFVLQRSGQLDQERSQVRAMGHALRQQFEQHVPGCTVAGDSQIVPLLIGDDAAAVEAAQRFQHCGFLVFAIRPPTVPPGTARLRFSLSAALQPSLVSALAGVV